MSRLLSSKGEQIYRGKWLEEYDSP